jgi:hypothetical protein
VFAELSSASHHRSPRWCPGKHEDAQRWQGGGLGPQADQPGRTLPTRLWLKPRRGSRREGDGRGGWGCVSGFSPLVQQGPEHRRAGIHSQTQTPRSLAGEPAQRRTALPPTSFLLPRSRNESSFKPRPPRTKRPRSTRRTSSAGFKIWFAQRLSSGRTRG